MSRWVLTWLLAGCAALAAQDQTTPQPPSKPGELQKERPKHPASDKKLAPPEEDKSYLREEHSFNPLQSQKSVTTGDFYLKKGKVQAAANRYEEATMWNDGNSMAWLKLGKASEKLRDTQAARTAYTKYLELEPNAKDAAEIRARLSKLK